METVPRALLIRSYFDVARQAGRHISLFLSVRRSHCATSRHFRRVRSVLIDEVMRLHRRSNVRKPIQRLYGEQFDGPPPGGARGRQRTRRNRDRWLRGARIRRNTVSLSSPRRGPAGFQRCEGTKEVTDANPSCSSESEKYMHEDGWYTDEWG